MRWRPEGWKECNTAEIYASQYVDSDREAVEFAYEAGADAMLEAVCQAIEKVENPYNVETFIGVCQVKSFEDCRQAIRKVIVDDVKKD